jgi:predicted RNA methylase
VVLVKADVSEEHIASVFNSVLLCSVLQLLVTANGPSLLDFFTTTIIIIIIIIFISINPVQSKMWKSQYKYKISSTEYEANIVIEASKYIKQGNII